MPTVQIRIHRATFDAQQSVKGFLQKQFSQGLNSGNKEFQFTHPAALTLARQDWRGIGWVEKSRKNRKYTHECRSGAVSTGENRRFS